jgi:hypothetical protein
MQQQSAQTMDFRISDLPHNEIISKGTPASNGILRDLHIIPFQTHFKFLITDKRNTAQCIFMK